MNEQLARVEILEFIKTMSLAVIDLSQFLVVSYSVGEQTTVYTIDVHKDDMGKLLGKRGRNIDAIRDLVKCLSAKYQIRIVIMVEE